MSLSTLDLFTSVELPFAIIIPSSAHPLVYPQAGHSILVLDFGSQTSHLILRRLRALSVYAEMLPCTTKLADLTWKPKGIILSGGPSSVYDKGSPPYMNHFDKLVYLPEGFTVVAKTANSEFAGIAHQKKSIFGVQFHPELEHTPQGSELLRNFSIGDRFHAILVDNGLMRLNECKKVKETLQEHLRINPTVVDGAELFLSRLKGVRSQRRNARSLEKPLSTCSKRKPSENEAKDTPNAGKVYWSLQGT
ncbi:hypothetical protein QQX98_012400, partial [Neonectria punicea]